MLYQPTYDILLLLKIDNMSSPKKILYLVVGGHGSQPFMDTWTDGNLEIEHDLVFNVVDSGGHTGFLTTLFPNLLPLGDLRNNIANLLELSAEKQNSKLLDELAHLFNQRIVFNKFPELLKGVDLVLDILGPGDEIRNIVNQFTQEYIQKCNAMDLNQGIKHSLGNIFLGALQNQGTDFMKRSLKDLGLIPPNLNIYFLHHERLQLIATDTKGIRITGEAAIDVSTNPIHPSDFQLIDFKGHKITEGDISQEIVNLIMESNGIFIPSGSFENSYPALALFSEYLRERHCEMLRIVNATVYGKDVTFVEEMMYLNGKLGLGVKFMAPNNKIEILNRVGEIINFVDTRLLQTAIPKIYGKYKRENKVAQVTPETMQEFLEQCEQLGLQMTTEEIKYFAQFIYPIMRIHAYPNGNGHRENEQVLEKGFRHDPESVNFLVRTIFKYREINAQIDNIAKF